MNTRTLIILTAILVLLAGFDYLDAWTKPAVTAPNGNVAAPVNTGSVSQVKDGSFAAQMIFGKALPDANGVMTGGMVLAENQMRSPKYCDYAGQNCWDPSSMGGGATGGNEIVMFNSPVEIFPASKFSNGGAMNVSYDFVAAGYPSNIVRAYITSYGWSFVNDPANTCHDTVCIPNYPTLSHYPTFADQPNHVYTIAGLKKYANPLVGFRWGAWLPITGGVIDLRVACNSKRCGDYYNITANSINVELAGYECRGACQ